MLNQLSQTFKKLFDEYPVIYFKASVA